MFWSSRVALDEDGHFIINGVIPPDEYAVNVNNSVYTNVVAQYSLQFATQVGAILGQKTPPEWVTIANNLKIPFDQQKQIHPEFDGYAGQQIKQADVVLLGFPLMYTMPESVRYNDLVYYSGRTDPGGPAMTWSMHAIAWIELGDASNATSVFQRSYANIQTPFNVWTETPTGGSVNFITGAGGFLQAVLFGWSGMRLKDEGLHMNPILPSGVTAMRHSNVAFYGSRVDVAWDSEGITITVQSSSPDAPTLKVTNSQGTISLVLQKSVNLPLGETLLHAF